MNLEDDFPPEHLVACEMLEILRENIAPERRDHWQRVIDLIKQGTRDLLLDNATLKGRIYRLEKMYFYQNGNTPETLFLTDLEAMRKELLRMIAEDAKKENSDENDA